MLCMHTHTHMLTRMLILCVHRSPMIPIPDSPELHASGSSEGEPPTMGLVAKDPFV